MFKELKMPKIKTNDTKTASNTIDKYLTKSSIPQPIQVPNKSKKNNDQFYDDCLIENEQCDGCSTEIEKLKKQITEVKEKNKKVEDAIKSCRLIISDKDIEILNLQKIISSVLSVNHSNHSKRFEAVAKSDQRMFESFSSDFDSEQLRSLRSIPTISRNDSTFISCAVKSLYSENLHLAKNKSACGRKSKNSQNKEMMTPEKKKILADIFDERLQTIGLSLEEKNTRQKQLNRLIKYAFSTITKSIESNKIVEETRRQLNLDE